MEKEFVGGAIGTALSAVGTGLQTNEVLQIISIVITILGGIISMIVIPLLNWYQKAKQDGKITKEELKDGIDVATTGIEQLIEDNKKKDKGE